jgi:hypothetical protein
LSVPAPQRLRHDCGRWETIRYALDSNPRTFRLCLILVVAAAAPCLAVVAAVLIHHMLLCGSCSWHTPPPISGSRWAEYGVILLVGTGISRE